MRKNGIYALLMGAVTQLGCVVNARTFVDRFTFPSDDGPVEQPKAQYDLTLAATLVPTLVVGYHEPRAVAACFKDTLLSADRAKGHERVRKLWSFGSCMSTKTIDDKGALSACAAIHLRDLPHVKVDGSAVKLDCALSDVDQALAITSIADAGQALFSYHRGLRPEQRSFGEDGDPGLEMHDGAAAAIANAVLLLEHDPDHADAKAPARSELPSIAMSGGAAGGAFTAGYLFALLNARERAVAELAKAGDAAAVERIRTRERFGYATGASVGTLIAVVLDLYFSDASPRAARLPEALRRDLELCVGAGPVKGAGDRLPQACALSLIEREFTARNEWHHLCVEHADIFDLLGKGANSFMRFSPMRERLIRPFFRAFDELVTQNDFVREATAVDLRQNVMLALDERACNAMPETAHIPCLEAAVLASIEEPVFARQEDKVWSGLRGAAGEPGQWLDGGVRSGTPALRALQLSDWPAPRAPIQASGGPFQPLRVLAVNTNRAEGSPNPPIQGAFPVLFGMIGAFVGQARQWEQAFVVPFAQLRRSEACDLAPRLCEAPAAPPVISLPTPSLFTRAGLLTAVYAPEKLEPAGAASDAYQFDPFMMLGLFLLGERTFVSSDPRGLLGDLGWTTVRDHLDAARVAAWKKDVEGRVAAYRARFDDAAFRKRWTTRRKGLFDDCMRRCDESVQVTQECDVDLLAQEDLAKLRPAPAYLQR
jgi:hypothetical protein